MIRFGLCCISLKLKEQGYGHQTMTFKRFNSLPREEALETLGDRILNNLITTDKTIQFCSEHSYTYRVSSDIFPLITYDEANVSLEDLPNHDEIQDAFDNLSETISSTSVRVSAHPSEFNIARPIAGEQHHDGKATSRRRCGGRNQRKATGQRTT